VSGAQKKRNQRRVALLHEAQGGRCFWCGVATPAPIVRPVVPGEAVPDNRPTLDHIFSRLSPLRDIGANAQAVVMACYKCNTGRSVAEMAQFSTDEWRRRCGAPAKPARDATNATH
jgi:hypothetical protein